MRKNTIQALFLFHFLSLLALHAQQVGDDLVVAVSPKATMRGEANTQSKIVATLPTGTSVKVIAISGHTDEVMNISGRWLQVSHKGKTGWIFGPLLKRATETHKVRVVNGTIILEDPRAVPGADLAQLLKSVAAADVELEITTMPPDSFRQCSGNLVLKRGGKLMKDKNVFTCGGVSAESTWRVAEWQLISGKLYFTADKTSSEICHSENCQEGAATTTKTTQEFRNVKSVAPGKFTAEF